MSVFKEGIPLFSGHQFSEMRFFYLVSAQKTFFILPAISKGN